jgi:hypothetical protein
MDLAFACFGIFDSVLNDDCAEVLLMSLVGSIKLLRAENIGIPKLTLQVFVKSRFDTKLTPLGAHAEVRITANGYRHDLVGRSYFVGYALLDDPPHSINARGEATWTLSVPVTQFCLQEIEKSRKGRDIRLIAMVHFVGAIEESAGTSRYGRFWSGRVDSEESSSMYCSVRVPRSDWINWLKELGYGDYYLIEVPLRGVPERGELKKALAHLTDAWEHFNLGKDAEALGSCHKGFERVAHDHDAKPDQNGWEKILRNQDVDPVKREKMKHLLHRLCDYLHLGRHEAKDPKVQLDRVDSEYALILSQATLSYLARTSSIQGQSSRGISPVSNSPVSRKPPRKRSTKP